MCVCMCVCVCVCVCLCVCVFVYIYIYVCVCVCVCVFELLLYVTNVSYLQGTGLYIKSHFIFAFPGENNFKGCLIMKHPRKFICSLSNKISFRLCFILFMIQNAVQNAPVFFSGIMKLKISQPITAHKNGKRKHIQNKKYHLTPQLAVNNTCVWLNNMLLHIESYFDITVYIQQ